MKKYTNALYPDKINDLVDNDGNINPSMVPSGVEISGNSLVIPEQLAPEPVIEIDGVKYYHKQEFDLETLNSGVILNVLNGEEKGSAPVTKSNLPAIASGTAGPATISLLELQWIIGPDTTDGFAIYSTNHAVAPVRYTSRAFTVVDTQDEVTDKTKICLPTCSAYYGFLSEDGKTFISYYNLKGEGAPESVDSIKQGNNIIPIEDSRIPATSSADEGKILGINASGNIVPQTPVGGIKLYRHSVHVECDAAGVWFGLTFTSTDGTAITSISTLNNILSSDSSPFFEPILAYARIPKDTTPVTYTSIDFSIVHDPDNFISAETGDYGFKTLCADPTTHIVGQTLIEDSVNAAVKSVTDTVIELI